jgi:hypothetical protein
MRLVKAAARAGHIQVNPFRKLSQVIKKLRSKNEKVMSMEIIGRYGRLIRGIIAAD